jgi:hypothetical protein
MKTTRLIFVLLAAVPLLGCPKKFAGSTSDGGGATTSSSVAPSASQASSSAPMGIDVCALIPVATVASTTGIAVAVTDPPNGSGVPTCTYKTAQHLPKLIIAKSLATISGVKKLWPGGTDVPGVGDAAYLVPGGNELDVQKGSSVIRVAYEPATKQTDAERLAILTKLANLGIPVLAK